MKHKILLEQLNEADILNTPFALLWHENIPEDEIKDDAECSKPTTTTGWQDTDRDDQD